MRTIWNVLVCFVLMKCTECVEVNLTVHTAAGSIEGLKADDGDYLMFLGIPYASVNRSNPFGASLPHPRFDTTFKAFDDSGKCPQIEEFSNEYDGSLDCLLLNIYVPTQEHPTKHLKSIFLYLHGGSNRQGYNGRYLLGPKYLVHNDIIVITINYRIGPYGFICSGTPEVPGNQGLKDQYSALEWVRRNIEAFGGNPNKVTIAGHSAGSMSADFHILSDRPRLFHQAILQSGSALYPSLVIPLDENVIIKMANSLGFKADNESTAIAYLAKVDPKIIINATLSVPFGMCIEKKHNKVLPFISEHPEDVKAANAAGINILAGYTNREWLFGLYGTAFIEKFTNPNIFRDSLSMVFDFDDIDEMAKIVEEFYLGFERGGETTKYKKVDFLSDFDMVHPLLRSLEKYRKHKNTNIYEYFFAYDGKRNFFKNAYNVTESGAAHADELGYLFDIKLIKHATNEEDARMIEKMTTLWANFVKHGNPTPVVTNVTPVIWPPTIDSAQKVLRIDRNLTIQYRPFHSRFAFWDLFFRSNSYYLKPNVEKGQSRIRHQATTSSAHNQHISIPPSILMYALLFIIF